MNNDLDDGSIIQHLLFLCTLLPTPSHALGTALIQCLPHPIPSTPHTIPSNPTPSHTHRYILPNHQSSHSSLVFSAIKKVVTMLHLLLLILASAVAFAACQEAVVTTAFGVYVSQNGCCRTENNKGGTPDIFFVADVVACAAGCDFDSTCKYVEFAVKSGKCELHSTAMPKLRKCPGVACYKREQTENTTTSTTSTSTTTTITTSTVTSSTSTLSTTTTTTQSTTTTTHTTTTTTETSTTTTFTSTTTTTWTLTTSTATTTTATETSTTTTVSGKENVICWSVYHVRTSWCCSLLLIPNLY